MYYIKKLLQVEGDAKLSYSNGNVIFTSKNEHAFNKESK
jgi:hypothetical protein